MIIKKEFFKNPGILTLVLIVLSMTSCQSQSATIPYKVGQSYVFKVTVTDKEKTVLQTDTLSMTMKNKGIIGALLGMNMAEWTSRTFPDNKQKRGVNLEPDLVEIQMPINYEYLENENIVIAGYPSYSKSMIGKSTSESDHQFVKGYGKLAGKRLKQFKTLKDSSKVTFKNGMILCKVAAYKNLSGIETYGLYQLKTYYQENYGFVKMYYEYPNGKEIEFELIEIKNKH